MSSDPNPFKQPSESENPYEPGHEKGGFVAPAPPTTAEIVDNRRRKQRPYRGGWTVWISWSVILLITFGLSGTIAYDQLSPRPAAKDAAKVDLAPVNAQAKVMVATNLLQGMKSTREIAPLNAGQVEQRYAYAILVNEIFGAEDALSELEEIDQLIADEEYELSEDQQKVRDTIGALMEDYSTGIVNSDDFAGEAQFLEDRLGWVGKLIMHPPDSQDTVARKALEDSASFSLMKMGAIMGLLVMLGFLGLISLAFITIMGSTGKLYRRFPENSGNGHIYAETFAIWIAMFMLLQIGAGLVLGPESSQDTQMIVTLTIFFGSLSALIWPIIRGVRMGELREDIGLKFTNPFPTCGKGVAGYLATLPVLAIGFGCMIVIQLIMDAVAQHHPLSAPITGHPIQEDISSGNVTALLFVFLTACVAAPIVEETMFRGVLYRHIRDMTGSKRARWISIFLSAVLASFIFAAIHPQGLLGIPVLMLLAIGFSLVREWQDSLTAPMFMHFVHNFLVTCFAFSFLG